MSLNDRNSSKLKQLLICIVAVFALFWGLSKIFVILLVSPDDIAYQKILSGTTTGTPDGHAYFLRYPLGLLISLLYRIYDGISWYQIFLIGSLAVSVFLVLSRVIIVAKEKKAGYFILALILVSILYAADIVYLEWTATAGVIGGTAVFRYVTIPQKLSVKKSIREYGICILLYAFCFCLRNTVAYMMAPLIVVCWLYKLYNINKNRSFKTNKIKKFASNPENRRNVYFIAAMLLVVVCIMVVHKIGYGSKEWQDYKYYNRDRSTLMDYYGYPDYETYKNVYDHSGISYEAYLLMKEDYNLVIPCDDFKEMDIKEIAKISKKEGSKDFFSRIEKAGTDLKDIMSGSKYLSYNLLAAVILFFCFINYKEMDSTDLLYMITCVGWGMLMVFYLSFAGRLPDRVIKCIYDGVIMVLFGNAFNYWSGHRKDSAGNGQKFVRCIVFILGIMALGIIGKNTLKDIRNKNENANRKSLAYGEVLKYCAENEDNIYLRDFYSFSQRGEQFMDESYNVGNYIGSGGWSYNSPIYRDMLKELDCENFNEALITKDNIYYIVLKNRSNAVTRRLNRYFVHENMPVRAIQEEEFDTEYETVSVIHFVPDDSLEK